GFPDLWLDKSLSLMLVSSATFIVVSIQYSYLFSYVIAARDGLYFFRPDYWRHLSGIDTVILDKNGVVTCDEPEVQEVISLSDYAIKDVLRVAASLSQAGNESRFYPVRKRAEQHNVILDDVLETNVVKGKSISGKINGQVYRIGSQSVFEDAGLITSEINQKLKRWQEEGANIILLADESRIFGMVTIVDPVRDEVSEFIDCAHEKLGLKVVMLSHDNVGTSQVLANRYGFDDVVSEITDDGKEQAIENYTRSHSVLLISNRHDLVVDEKNRISLVNDALKSRYIKGDKAIVSLGVRLLSVLNLIATARKVEVRLKRILYVVGVAKLLIVTGIVAGFLSLGTVVGLEFLLGFWVLFSTYVPSRELKVKKIDRKSAFT
ncbi:MAG: HAD family hydrolase, partial [Gammaproteobacteria bacterium]|nr:HAD family hydrolase [Gammaproteobacteria bacterium]